MIQHGIYKQIYRSYLKANWQHQQEQRKQRTAAVLAAGAQGYGMCAACNRNFTSKFSEGQLDMGRDAAQEQQLNSQLSSPLLSPVGSLSSDCIAARAEDEQESKSCGPSSCSSLQLKDCVSPGSSASLGECDRVAELPGFDKGLDTELGPAAAGEDNDVVAGSGCRSTTPAAAAAAAAGSCTELFGLAGEQRFSGCPEGSFGGSSSAQLGIHTDGLQRRTNYSSLA
jgi:hypothetical protein